MTGQRSDDRRRKPVPPRPAPPPRKYPPKPMWVYKMRRWGAVLILLFLIVLFIRACVPSEHDREMEAWQEQSEQMAPQEIPGDVEPSRPVEMVIPSVDLHIGFQDSDCLYRDGAITPDPPSDACVFTDSGKPYALPGTAAQDIVVIAGDGSAGFSSLYDADASQHTISPSDELFMRTDASGDQWLRYQATDVHDPEGEGLSNSAEIWGNTAMPGRLLTVVALPGEGGPGGSAVIGWQLQDVVDQVSD